jgi:hypothetical protein
METYFMACEVRNDHGNIVGRYNVTLTTTGAAKDALSDMMLKVCKKTGQCRANVFATAFNKV